MPAGRPNKKRTSKSYRRDIESISRLRTSIMQDQSLPREELDAASDAADKLVRALVVLLKHEDNDQVA